MLLFALPIVMNILQNIHVVQNEKSNKPTNGGQIILPFLNNVILVQLCTASQKM